jgi:membrane protease YdiL (CAAX protease family)
MVGFLIFAAVLFLLGQAGVGFRPIKNGMLASMAFVILIAAFVNAAMEEFIYRGVMQTAILPAAGKTIGLWIQGMFFGLMHWGSSVGLIAALPISLLIGLGSVYWGKAVLDTKGLSWVIVAHALMDIAIMAAYFLPGSGKE